MYPCYQNGIVKGRESFPLRWILGENALYLTMWFLAGVLLWPIWRPAGVPVLALAWAAIVVIMQVLLKKHNCTGCYYYDKWCHLGWGKLASAMFKQDSGNPDTGKKLVLFYIIPPPLLVLVALIFALTQQARMFYWSILALYVALNAVSVPIRVKGCRQCAMRGVCPGSASK